MDAYIKEKYDENGDLIYLVTSSAAVGMSDGSGSLDKKILDLDVNIVSNELSVNSDIAIKKLYAVVWDGNKITSTTGWSSIIIRVDSGDILILGASPFAIHWFSGIPKFESGDNYLRKEPNALKITTPSDAKYVFISFPNPIDSVNISKENSIINSVKKNANDISKNTENISRIEKAIETKSYLDIQGGYINNDVEIGNKVSVTPISPTNESFKCSIVSCKEGDIFYVTGAGGFAGTLWTFLDIDNNLISKAAKETTYYTDLKCEAPANAKTFIVNYYMGAINDKPYNTYTQAGSLSELINKTKSDLEQKISSSETSLKKYVNDAIDNVGVISYLAGKRIICFGDSITEFRDSTNKRYSDYIAEYTSAIVINAGIGGTMLTVRAEVKDEPTTSNEAYAALDIPSIVTAFAENNWTKQIAAANYLKENAGDDNTAIINEVKEILPTDVDIVTIFAGTNNIYGGDESLGTPGNLDNKKLAGGLSIAIEKLLQANPKLAIYIFTPLPRYLGDNWSEWDDANFSDNFNNGQLVKICKTITDTAQYYHVPVCDMYYSIGWNKFNWSNFFQYTNDGTHPLKGFMQIGKKMLSYIESNLIF